ncbi:hypothetical protein V7S43_014078 [Phytophthora oleae]|uniref:RxLR effector protein n=1 Tax=Phytophthora oleae TaxID=2107226 RepID=A0ABD3F2P9_9STRA
MGKHVLLVVVELLLLVATQAHTQPLRESSSLSSADASSSMVFSLPSHATIYAGDPPSEPAVNLRGESSSSLHDVDLIDTIRVARYIDFPSTSASSIDSAAASAAVAGFSNTIHVGSISGTSSSDETGINEDAASPSLELDSERASVSTTAPQIYVLSRSSQSRSTTTSSSDEASQLSSTPSSFDIFEGGSSYSAGTVSPNEERSAIESTKLELSTSHEAASSHASHSSKKATSTTDQAASSNQDGDDTNGNNSTMDLTSSNFSLSSPIFYGVVLAVAGLVGGIFAFRSKRKRNVSGEWLATEAPAETPPPPCRDPPPSQVRVIIDDHHFAVL